MMDVAWLVLTNDMVIEEQEFSECEWEECVLMFHV